MIKINLLSSYKENTATAGSSLGGGGGGYVSDDDEKKQLLKDVAVRLLILSIGPIGLYAYEAYHIPVLSEQQAKLTQQYNELKQFNDSKQALNEEIKKYEDEQRRFNAQMDFINKIASDKLNEYKLFTLLKVSTPESVWIKKLSLDKNVVKISAESNNTAEIEKFITQLSNADFIKDLVPLNQTNTPSYKDTGIPTTSFEIQAELVSSQQAIGGE